MSAVHTAQRRGIAIVAAMYFITIVGVLAVAVLFTARQWSRSGVGGLQDAALSARTEALLVDMASTWNASERAEQPVGSRVKVVAGVGSGGSAAERIASSTYVTRLTRTLYWLDADARPAGSSGGRHRSTLLVRVPPWQPPVRSALLSAGDVLLGAHARVLTDGGASDCPNARVGADVGIPGITLARDANLQLADGYPAADRPTSRTDSTLIDPLALLGAGGASWDALTERADIRVPADAHRSPMPVTDANGCADNLSNWGEPHRSTPASPCENRRRVIHALGDLTLDGGRAQGVLLVEGRLYVAGPLLLSGVVIARGGIETLADGVTISGIVLSGAPNAAHPAPPLHRPVSLLHESRIRFDVCDAQHGMTSTMQARVVRERGWADVF